MPPVGFEPTISAGEWPQTYALDHAATGTDNRWDYTGMNITYGSFKNVNKVELLQNHIL
jgi:hypothetical protein